MIRSRRTIKEFAPRFLDWDHISKILDAGRHAPTAGNLQNWKFVVALNEDLKKQLAEAALQQYEIINASVLIVIFAEPEKAERYYGDRGKLYSIQNCAAAAQNMLLEAHSLGLGGWWVYGFEEEMVKRAFGAPDDAVPYVILAIGHPKAIPQKPPKIVLESTVYFNRWRNRVRDPAKYMYLYSLIIQRKFQKAKEKIKGKMNQIKEKLNKEK